MGNEEIIKFLNEYVEIPNPQYAVMLKGAWGCGKTFFRVSRFLVGINFA